jgi:hypothetical protein
VCRRFRADTAWDAAWRGGGQRAEEEAAGSWEEGEEPPPRMTTAQLEATVYDSAALRREATDMLPGCVLEGGWKGVAAALACVPPQHTGRPLELGLGLGVGVRAAARVPLFGAAEAALEMERACYTHTMQEAEEVAVRYMVDDAPLPTGAALAPALAAEGKAEVHWRSALSAVDRAELAADAAEGKALHAAAAAAVAVLPVAVPLRTLDRVEVAALKHRTSLLLDEAQRVLGTPAINPRRASSNAAGEEGGAKQQEDDAMWDAAGGDSGDDDGEGAAPWEDGGMTHCAEEDGAGAGDEQLFASVAARGEGESDARLDADAVMACVRRELSFDFSECLEAEAKERARVLRRAETLRAMRERGAIDTQADRPSRAVEAVLQRLQGGGGAVAAVEADALFRRGPRPDASPGHMQAALEALREEAGCAGGDRCC